MTSEYVFSGTLSEDAPTYIKRQADEELYQELKARQFCYVFNSRKTGKSSLRVRVMNRLKVDGFACVAIDLSLDEVQLTTSERWYFSILDSLTEDFDLDIDLEDWWDSQQLLSPLGRLRKFIESVLLKQISENIVIFIDEIDSVLSFNFPTDDFFAFLRACYNRRVDNSEFDRLTFCLLGVATPSTLMADKQRTPFNIGRAIELKGFTLEEAQPLIPGLTGKVAEPKQVLAEILQWSGGQPFLTQKLCDLVVRHQENNYSNLSQLVEDYVIDNWEARDEPEHLRTIRDRLLDREQNTARLLGLYQQILQQREIAANYSDEQLELRLSGIIIEDKGKLRVYNPIYEQIFNLSWSERQLANLRPYSEAIAAWLTSGCQDESRLLRGNALKDAQEWAEARRLSHQDYDFLNKSEKLAQQELQQAFLLERNKELETRLRQEKKIAKIQKLWLSTLAIAFLIASGLGTIAFYQYRKSSIEELKATVESSQALFSSQQKLDALIAAIKAKQQLQKLGNTDPNLAIQVERVLEQAVYNVREYDRFSNNSDRVYGVAIAAEGKLIAVAGADKNIQLWKKNNRSWQHTKTITGHTGWIVDVAISGDSQTIVSASSDRTVKLWRRNGTLLTTLQADRIPVNTVAINRDGSLVVSGSENGTIKIWRQGKLQQNLQGHTGKVTSVAMSDDGELIVSASEDKTIKIWQQGKLLKTLKGHTEGVRSVAISRDCAPRSAKGDRQLIVSGSSDRTVKIWNLEGKEIATLRGHSAPVYSVAISPNGQQIISGSADNTIKIWRRDGTEISTLKGHTNRVWDVAYSPDGNWIASASWDKTVRLWRPNHKLVKILSGHQDVAIAVAFGNKFLASASDDRTVKLWQPDGNLITTFGGHKAEVYDVAIHPDNKIIASASADKTIQLWQTDGTILATLKAHNAPVWAVAFSPDGKKIVSGSEDNTVKLWQIDGTLLHTLRGHNRRIWDVAVSPNGKWLASGSEDNTVKLWQIDGTLLHTLEGHQDAVRTVTISPDGEWLASGSEDGTVKLWNRYGRSIATLQTSHATTIKGIAISPNGQWLASASDDNAIDLWYRDRQHWYKKTTLRGHESSVWAVAFSPDGYWLASAGEDRKIMLWNLATIPSLNSTKYACHWIDGYLQHLRSNAKFQQMDKTNIEPLTIADFCHVWRYK